MKEARRKILCPSKRDIPTFGVVGDFEGFLHFSVTAHENILILLHSAELSTLPPLIVRVSNE